MSTDIDVHRTAQLDAEAYHCTQTKICHWKCSDDEMNTWSGSCGLEWYFSGGGPVENGVNYCPECGGVVMLPTVPETESER